MRYTSLALSSEQRYYSDKVQGHAGAGLTRARCIILEQCVILNLHFLKNYSSKLHALRAKKLMPNNIKPKCLIVTYL